MKVKTYLPLFSGFYNSYWDDISFEGEEEYFDLPNDKEFWELFDWNKYYNHIAKEMCNEVQYLLSDFVSNIEFECIISPKYYNFENDSINCEITFDESKVMQYLNDNHEKFSEYVKYNYTSRDGFITFHSNNPQDWMQDWDEHKVGSILNFICENERFVEPYDIKESNFSLFYKEEIYQYERTDFSD
jgi:hypothetical protein